MTSSYESVSLIIIGSGPAAYSACLYSQHLNPILFEGSYKDTMSPGGQLMTTTDVDNYPGFPNGVQGPALMEKMKSQIKTSIRDEFITKISKSQTDNNVFEVQTENGEMLYTKAIIIATGAQARRLHVPGTDTYWQKGISACAVCDGWAFVKKTVVVIGGGDTAMEEAKHLANIADKVILIHRNDKFKARKDMLERVKKTANVEIKIPYTLECVKGDNETMNCAYFRNKETKELIKIEADGLFFAIGHNPNTNFFGKDLIKLDNDGYIMTDEKCKTSCDGIYACGDVQDKKYRQAVTAAGTGCIAGIAVSNYLKNKFN